MDEYNSGMDAEVKLYFKKILRTLGALMLWVTSFITAGIYFGLAFFEKMHWYNLVFYACMLLATAWFVRYLYRTWTRGTRHQEL